MQDRPVNPPGPTGQRNPFSDLYEVEALSRNATALMQDASLRNPNG